MNYCMKPVRIISLLLSVMMVLSMLSVNVWATDYFEDPVPEAECSQQEDSCNVTKMLDESEEEGDEIVAEEESSTKEEKTESEKLRPQEIATGSCGKKVKWSFNDETGTMTISGTGALTDNETMSEYQSEIKKVVIRNGVTSIGDSAFAWCENLTSVTFPNSLKSIGESAFEGCESLKSVVFPDTLTSIEESAFYECKNLTSVTFPDGLTSIGESAFCKCDNLTDMTIPDSVSNIGACAFGGCNKLTSVRIPNNVTRIEEQIFYDCKNLTDITIPNGVTRIGYGAFLSCDRLTSIAIPDSVTKIDSNAFGVRWDEGTDAPVVIDGFSVLGYAGSFTEYYAKQNKLSFSSVGQTANPFDPENGVIESGTCGDGLSWVLLGSGILTVSGSGPMWDFWMDNEPWIDYEGMISEVAVQNGVTSIGDNAFIRCPNLKKVTIPSGVKQIGTSAFAGSSLQSVTIPDSVKEIGEGAFRDCAGLIDVDIEKGVEVIWDSAFRNCYNLKSVDIPDSVRKIGYYAFGFVDNDEESVVADGFTLFGSSDSVAEQYAQTEGIPFIAIRGEKAIQNLNENLSKKLEEVEQDPSKVEEVVEELKKEDQELIREAVTTNQETYEMIERLEEVYIQEKKIEVEIKAAEDAPLTQNEIKVVGAAFNAKPGARKVTVEVTKPEQIGRLHDSGVKSLQEIGINIYSDNEKVESLDVPIAVTVPVPKKADVKKIKIYNFFSGNRIETMTPSVVTINKTKMLRFATGNPKDVVIATLVSAQKKYTVTLNANGGKMKIKKKTVKKTTIKLKKGAKYGKLPKPTRKKYKFQGWYTDKKKGKKVTAKTKMNTAKNTTLYARWKKQ